MSLKRLQTFIQVVETRRFSEAAHIMQLTQSGVSRQIKTLEEELGVQLLNRNTTAVELTPAGKHVYRKAKQLLVAWNTLVQECRTFRTELGGTLKIGASTIPGTCLLPRIVKAVRDKHPKIEFSVAIDDSSDILARLEHDQIDLALIGSEPNPVRFHSQSLAEDRLVLAGHRLQPALSSIGDIRRLPFIAREQGSGTRDAINRALRQHGIDPDELNVVAEVSGTESILAMVKAGVGVAFVSRWVMDGPGRGEVAALYELPTDRRFYVAFLPGKESDPLVRAFLHETAAAGESSF